MSIELRFAVKIGDRFVSEEDAADRVGSIGRLVDLDDLDGALHLVCDGVEILGNEEHDYINYLVLAILDVIDPVVRGESVTVSFPDQPLELRFKTKRETLIVSAGNKSAAVPRRAFLRELYDLCRRFLGFMSAIYPSGMYEFRAKKLAEVPLGYPTSFAPTVHRFTVVPAMVDIALENDSNSTARGTVDFLIGDTLIRVDSVGKALELVPAIDALANAVVKLRSGQAIVNVALGRGPSSLWFSQQKADHKEYVALAYREAETGMALLSELDRECGDAAGRIVRVLRDRQLSIEPRLHQLAHRVLEVWPEGKVG